MFKMKKISGCGIGLAEYAQKEIVSDYYGVECPGQWTGKLCKEFNILSGDIIKPGDEKFAKLCLGLRPDRDDKTRLTCKGRLADGIKFFDFVCNAQKSVSIIALASGDDRVAYAHDRAVEKALKHIEENAAIHQMVKGRKDIHEKSDGGMLCARFRHSVSRSLDPHMHTHCMIANVAKGSDGKLHALDEHQMMKAINLANAVYQNELATELKGLGYDLERSENKYYKDAGAFEIKGVPRIVIDKFSSRRKEIEEIASRREKELGRELTEKEYQKIAWDSRSDKEEFSLSDLKAKWEREGGAEALKCAQHPSQERTQSVSASEITDHSIQHVFERKSVATIEEIQVEALRLSLGRASTDGILREIEKSSGDGQLLKAGTSSGLELFTTEENLRRERECINMAERMSSPCHALNATYKAFQGKEESFWEQKEAIEGILRNPSRISILLGAAGAGKTTALQELVKGLKAAPKAMFSSNSAPCPEDTLRETLGPAVLLAPTHAACDVLKKDGFKNVLTVSAFLQEAKKPLRSARSGGLPLSRLPGNLAKHDFRGKVLIIDESGMNSVTQGREVLEIAERLGCRIVFSGDHLQHESVEAGNYLRLLVEHSNVPRFKLKDIRRQKDPDYLEAAKAFSSGDNLRAFEILDKKGWVKETPGYLEEAVEAYMGYRKAPERQSVIVVCPTNNEVDEVNKSIRDHLQREGMLKDDEVTVHSFRSANLTESEKSDLTHLKEGMTLCFTRALRSRNEEGKLKVAVGKGECVRIESITENKIHLENGATFDIRRFKDFDVGEMVGKGLATGDKIILGVNADKLRNGMRLSVAGFGNGIIKCTDDEKRKIEIPMNYAGIRHNYCTTSHKSQGATADIVIIGAATLDSRAAYVANTRGRYKTHVFTPDKERLIRSITNTKERQLATDVIQDSSEKESEKAQLLVGNFKDISGSKNPPAPPIRNRNIKILERNDEKLIPIRQRASLDKILFFEMLQHSKKRSQEIEELKKNARAPENIVKQAAAGFRQYEKEEGDFIKKLQSNPSGAGLATLLLEESYAKAKESFELIVRQEKLRLEEQRKVLEKQRQADELRKQAEEKARQERLRLEDQKRAKEKLDRENAIAEQKRQDELKRVALEKQRQVEELRRQAEARALAEKKRQEQEKADKLQKVIAEEKSKIILDRISKAYSQNDIKALASFSESDAKDPTYGYAVKIAKIEWSKLAPLLEHKNWRKIKENSAQTKHYALWRVEDSSAPGSLIYLHDLVSKNIQKLQELEEKAQQERQRLAELQKQAEELKKQQAQQEKLNQDRRRQEEAAAEKQRREKEERERQQKEAEIERQRKAAIERERQQQETELKAKAEQEKQAAEAERAKEERDRIENHRQNIINQMHTSFINRDFDRLEELYAKVPVDKLAVKLSPNNEYEIDLKSCMSDRIYRKNLNVKFQNLLKRDPLPQLAKTANDCPFQNAINRLSIEFSLSDLTEKMRKEDNRGFERTYYEVFQENRQAKEKLDKNSGLLPSIFGSSKRAEAGKQLELSNKKLELMEKIKIERSFLENYESGDYQKCNEIAKSNNIRTIYRKDLPGNPVEIAQKRLSEDYKQILNAQKSEDLEKTLTLIGEFGVDNTEPQVIDWIREQITEDALSQQYEQYHERASIANELSKIVLSSPRQNLDPKQENSRGGFRM